MPDPVQTARTRARPNRIVAVVTLCLVSACAASRAWPTDRARIAFSGGPTKTALNIYVTTPDGASFEQLTLTNTWNEYPAWSRHGKTIAFSSVRDGLGERLFLMDADGGNQRPITDGPGDWVPTWSPDGDAIAFTSGRLGHDRSGIYVADLASGRQTRLTALNTKSSHPTWRPGGGAIAYVSVREGFFDLHVMDEQGGDLTQLADRETDDTSPSWQPRADMLAFDSWDTVDASADIYTIKSDGSDERRITEHPAWDYDASWSPNGREVLFTSRRDGDPGLYITDMRARVVRRVMAEQFARIWGASWFDPAFPRSVSPVGRHATTWGWMKRLGALAQ